MEIRIHGVRACVRACAQISAEALQLNDTAPVTVKREFTAVCNTQNVHFYLFPEQGSFVAYEACM